MTGWIVAILLFSGLIGLHLGWRRRYRSLALAQTVKPAELNDALGVTAMFENMAEGVLVSGGGPDKNVRLWSLARDGECVASFEHGATVRGVAVSPLGFIASAGGKFKQLIIHGPAPVK